ncbi:hypothetical protein [Candidatus Aeolococcus gillhamiae]|uniref:Uncharacterized protein n=1 Tax=Candidatus Aeolococcus gillhamiae TaxID=3127015 RepID=A0A2W6A098_9BACT|nr:MAG: hypothetical protein DLM65_11740 [Candidatus Dormibacter sp. RRmetagenome_bin12]
MEVGETLRVESIADWRSWLAENCADRREIWLINDRKGPERRTPDYEELLDEAVCHGWVDVLVRGLDERRYLTRWMPRRPGGNWTPTNRERARRLVAAGRMSDAGLASLPDDLRAELNQ